MIISIDKPFVRGNSSSLYIFHLAKHIYNLMVFMNYKVPWNAISTTLALQQRPSSQFHGSCFSCNYALTCVVSVRNIISSKQIIKKHVFAYSERHSWICCKRMNAKMNDLHQRLPHLRPLSPKFYSGASENVRGYVPRE